MLEARSVLPRVLALLLAGVPLLPATAPTAGAQNRPVVVEVEPESQLDKPLNLGRSKSGYKAKLDLLAASARGVTQHYLTVEVTWRGERGFDEGIPWIFIERMQVSAGDRSFELEVPAERRHRARRVDALRESARLSLGNPYGESGTLKGQHTEGAAFEISVEQLRRMAAADEVRLEIRGDTGRSSEHTLDGKHLARLAEWVENHLDVE